MSEVFYKKEFTIQGGDLQKLIFIKLHPDKFLCKGRKVNVQILKSESGIQKYKREIRTTPTIPGVIKPFVRLYEYIIDETITIDNNTYSSILQTTNGEKFNFYETLTCYQDKNILKAVFTSKIINTLSSVVRSMAIRHYLNNRILELKTELEYTTDSNVHSPELFFSIIEGQQIDSLKIADSFEEIDIEKCQDENDDGYDYNDIANL